MSARRYVGRVLLCIPELGFAERDDDRQAAADMGEQKIQKLRRFYLADALFSAFRSFSRRIMFSIRITSIRS
jgi:ABC-type arginine/histidine transport system permease subunit